MLDTAPRQNSIRTKGYSGYVYRLLFHHWLLTNAIEEITRAKRIPKICQSADQKHRRADSGRRPWQPSDATDRLARQAGGAVWRQVPHHRFSAVQLHEFRHPPHRRGDPVQVAFPDQARPARLGFPARRIQRVRRSAAGPAARGGRDLVQGHRRCGVPEPGHPARLQAGIRAGAGRRSCLQDGLRRNDRQPCAQRGRHDRGLHRSATEGSQRLRRDGHQ
jgi:hypothetical protein